MADPTTSTGGRWAALEVPPFRWLWAGSVCSFLSVQMMVVARGWLAWELTGSSAAIGGVLLALGVPLLVVTPWGGVMADRLEKRTVIRLTTAAIAVTQFAVGIAVVTEVVEYWMLLLSAALQGAAFSVLAPTRIAFTSELLDRSLLSNGVVLQQLAMNGTRVFGPSLAGVLVGIDAIGIGGVYLLSSAVMAGAVVSTLALPLGPPAGSGRERPLDQLKAGIAHVRERPELSALLVTSFLVVMAAFPWFGLLPELIDDALGSGTDGFGFVLGASAVGAVTASWLVADRSSGPDGVRFQIIGGFVLGASIIVLGSSPNLATAVGIALVVGFCSAVFQAVNNSLAIEAAEPEFHGRVQALLMLGFSGFGIISLPLGALAEVVGIRTTYTVMGAATLVVIAGYASWRRLGSTV